MVACRGWLRWATTITVGRIGMRLFLRWGSASDATLEFWALLVAGSHRILFFSGSRRPPTVDRAVAGSGQNPFLRWRVCAEKARAPPLGTLFCLAPMLAEYRVSGATGRCRHWDTLAQSSRKARNPTSVYGCWTIFCSTENGMVAMSAPARAAWMTCWGCRRLAASTSVPMP